MKTFSSKSNAARAAKAAGLTEFTVGMNAEGKFYHTAASAVGATDSAPVTISKVKPANRKAEKAAKVLQDAKVAPVKTVKTKGMNKTQAWKVQEKGRKQLVREKRAEVFIPLPPGVALKADIHTSPKATNGIVRREGQAEAGYIIEKNRPVANGVKRPSSTTVSGQLWGMLDEVAAKLGGPRNVIAGLAKQIGVKHGINLNNVSIEFYQWRKFNGVRGRINLKKAQAAAK